MAARDRAATEARIVAAATAEFAEHGLAGGRVDRIAAAAVTNKAQLYHYFGSKERLFDTVFDRYVERNLTTAPLDARDLPGWATALYDYYLQDPVLVRLVVWARLERTPTGDLFARTGGIDASVLARVAEAQREGILLDSMRPIDIFALTVAMAGTWAQASITIAATPGDDAAEHDRRRAALTAAVGAAFCVGYRSPVTAGAAPTSP